MKLPPLHRKHVHVALLTGLLLVAGVLAQKYRPGFSSASSEVLEITCSSQRETNPCEAARHGVRGDWISESENAKKINEDKKSAWVQYTSKETVMFTGATLINRGAAHNDILDGHFEFGGGRRYPQEGGIGALETITEPLITFLKPFKSKTIKFVVDKVSEGTVDVGLTVFEVVYAKVVQTPEVAAKLALAVTILSDESVTMIERIEPVKRDDLPVDREAIGFYTLQALDEDDQVIDQLAFTPNQREIITTFSDKAPEAISVVNTHTRTILYIPYQATIAKFAIIDGLNNERVDIKVLPDAFLEALQKQSGQKPIIIPFLEKVKEVLKLK